MTAELEEMTQGLGAVCTADLERVKVPMTVKPSGELLLNKPTQRPVVPDSEWDHAVRYVERHG